MRSPGFSFPNKPKRNNAMFESIAVSLLRQAALLTKPQQEEFTMRIAEAIATLVSSTGTQIDDELLRSIGLPLGGAVIEKLQALV